VTITEAEVAVVQGEHLWWLLAEAMRPEHMIMCQGHAVGTVGPASSLAAAARSPSGRRGRDGRCG